MTRLIKGKNLTWEKQDLVGKGDAGEVYHVTSGKPQLSAVMKCPAKVATGGTIMRQASQIENEGRILEMLDGLGWSGKRFTLLTPKLLDESNPGTSQTAAYFIISQQAGGDSLEELLRQAQHDGKPLSHRLLLKIISAMFQLFELIHAKDILWNDVKPGHIFWDANNRTITVIDWGNGIILDEKGGNPSQHGRFIEDISQMLSEFGRILETNSPQLLWDLGWPQGSFQDLNKNDIDILRKRVAFLENYYELKVVENRALEKLYQEKMDGVADLDQLITCQNELSHLGEVVDQEIVHNAAEALFLKCIRKGQDETWRMVLDRVKPLPWFGSDIEWGLIDNIFSRKEHVFNPDTLEIVKLIFSSSWVEVYWKLFVNGFFDQDNQARKGISFKLRQLILPEACANYHLQEMVRDLVDELHIKLIQVRMDQLRSDELGTLEKISNEFSTILNYWTRDDITPGFMGDHVVKLQNELPNLRQIGMEINPCMEHMINTQAQLVRTMLFAWNSADFENLRKALHKLFVWDPDMADVDRLDTRISSIDLWMQKLISGPQSQIEGFDFIRDMLEQYPDLTQELGQPIWLKELLTGLSDLITARDADQITGIINKFELPISWFDQQIPVALSNSSDENNKKLSEENRKLIESFHQALRSSSDLAGILSAIHKSIRWAYPGYYELKIAFDRLFLPNTGSVMLHYAERVPSEDLAKYKEAVEVLKEVKRWIKDVNAGGLLLAGENLKTGTDWKILQECRNAQHLWQNYILPQLAKIKEKRWDPVPVEAVQGKDEVALTLDRCINELSLVKDNWSKIKQVGCEESVVQIVLEHLDNAKKYFLTFMDHPVLSAPHLYLLSTFHSEVATHYQDLVRLVNHAKNLSNSIKVLNDEDMLMTGLANSSAEELLYTIGAMNAQFPGYEPDDTISTWLADYQKMVDISGKDGINQVMLSLDSKHPLFKWFHARWRLFTQ